MKEFLKVFPKKIKIIEATPEISNTEVFGYGKCYVAISLGNRFFESYKLAMLVQWIAKRFSGCVIVLADSLYRFNVEMLNCSSEHQALASAKQKGLGTLHEIERVIAEHGQGKFELRTWDDFRLRSDFSRFHEEIIRIYQTNDAFRTSVQADAETYVNRIVNRGEKICADKEKATMLSIAFIQEECAVFSMLSSEGYMVDISPDTYLCVLKDIAAGKITGVPDSLKNKIILKIKSVAK